MPVFSKLSTFFRFCNQNPENVSFFHMYVTLPAHVILVDHITLIILCVQWKPCSPSLCNFLQVPGLWNSERYFFLTCQLNVLYYLDKIRNLSIKYHSRLWLNVTELTREYETAKHHDYEPEISCSITCSLLVDDVSVRCWMYTGLSKKMDGIWNRYNLKKYWTDLHV